LHQHAEQPSGGLAGLNFIKQQRQPPGGEGYRNDDRQILLLLTDRRKTEDAALTSPRQSCVFYQGTQMLAAG
jgi:hypothetical protein